MSRLRPLVASSVLGLAILLVAASSVLAGGWAEIRPAPDTGEGPPVAGEAAGIRFTVLQHGQTPVDWEQATVHLTDLSTGITTVVTARPEGGGGHYTASFTPTEPGFWTWRVTLRDLATDPVMHALAVHHPDGAPPALDPTALRTAVEQAATLGTARAEQLVNDRMLTYADQLSDQRAATADLQAQLQAVMGSRDELAARLATLEGGPGTVQGGTPTAIVLLLAVLAGATAGFVTAALARRGGVRRIDVSPAPSPDPAPMTATSTPPLGPAGAPRGSTPA